MTDSDASESSNSSGDPEDVQLPPVVPNLPSASPRALIVGAHYGVASQRGLDNTWGPIARGRRGSVSGPGCILIGIVVLTRPFCPSISFNICFSVTRRDPDLHDHDALGVQLAERGPD